MNSWRSVAANIGLTASQIDRMSSAFENTDMRMAITERITVSTKEMKKDKRSIKPIEPLA